MSPLFCARSTSATRGDHPGSRSMRIWDRVDCVVHKKWRMGAVRASVCVRRSAVADGVVVVAPLRRRCFRRDAHVWRSKSAQPSWRTLFIIHSAVVAAFAAKRTTGGRLATALLAHHPLTPLSTKQHACRSSTCSRPRSSPRRPSSAAAGAPRRFPTATAPTSPTTRIRGTMLVPSSSRRPTRV